MFFCYYFDALLNKLYHLSQHFSRTDMLRNFSTKLTASQTNMQKVYCVINMQLKIETHITRNFYSNQQQVGGPSAYAYLVTWNGMIHLYDIGIRHVESQATSDQDYNRYFSDANTLNEIALRGIHHELKNLSSLLSPRVRNKFKYCIQTDMHFIAIVEYAETTTNAQLQSTAADNKYQELL